MARMHSRRKGQSKSTRPMREKAPQWQGLSAKQVEETVVKLARDGRSSAMIGTILRDQHGVPSVKLATGKKMGQILKDAKAAPKYPEDMTNLIKRAVRLSEHLAERRKDLHNQRSLALIEAKIRRLGRYYVREGVLPATWSYSLAEAKLIVE